MVDLIKARIQSQIEKAATGDVESAKTILREFCGGIELKAGVPDLYLEYIARSFRTILEEMKGNNPPNANKALGLTTDQRGRRGSNDILKRDQDIAFKIMERTKGVTVEMAVNDLSEEYDLSPDTIRGIYKKINKRWSSSE